MNNDNDQEKITAEGGSNTVTTQFQKVKHLKESWQELLRSFQLLESNLRSLQDSLRFLQETLSTLQKLNPAERAKVAQLVQQALQRTQKGFIYQVSSSLH